MFDTSVHLVSTRPVLRVEEPPGGAGARRDLAGRVRRVVVHPSQRRRTPAVPVAIGSGGQVLTWIDVFD